MSNCVMCSTGLKFMNTPTFGAGKLNDGGIVCTSCYKQINNANPSVAFKLKNYTLSQVQTILQEKEEAKKLADKLTRIMVKVEVKAGENGKIFGGVSAKEIADNLKKIAEKNGLIDVVIV